MTITKTPEYIDTLLFAKTITYMVKKGIDPNFILNATEGALKCEGIYDLMCLYYEWDDDHMEQAQVIKDISDLVPLCSKEFIGEEEKEKLEIEEAVQSLHKSAWDEQRKKLASKEYKKSFINQVCGKKC
jgi:hypothetical protein